MSTGKMNALPACLFALAVLIPPPALAPSATAGARPLPEIAANATREAALAARTGYLRGETREIVYTVDDRILSELDWDLEGVYLAGAAASWRPVKPLTLNAAFMTNVNKGSGEMEDFDFLDASMPDTWTHYSVSAADVDELYFIDANAWLRLVGGDRAALHLIAGFAWDHIQWTAVGGDFIYSTGGGFRNNRGSFANVPVVDLELDLYKPYLGLGGAFAYRRLTLVLDLLYSPLAWSEARDEHLLRNLVFDFSDSGVEWLSMGASLGWRFSEGFSASLSADWQGVLDAPGGTDMLPFQGGLFGDGDTNMTLETLILTLSLSYAF